MMSDEMNDSDNKYFYFNMIGNIIGIRGLPDLRWIRPCIEIFDKEYLYNF